MTGEELFVRVKPWGERDRQPIVQIAEWSCVDVVRNNSIVNIGIHEHTVPHKD